MADQKQQNPPPPKDSDIGAVVNVLSEIKTQLEGLVTVTRRPTDVLRPADEKLDDHFRYLRFLSLTKAEQQAQEARNVR